MPRVTFTEPAGLDRNASAFPKMKLGDGEIARVACLEQPVMVYVHTLEKPKILNGKAVMEEKLRKDKSTYTKNAMRYVSSFLCLGDYDVMLERGVDPDNCPACKQSTRSDEVKAPKPKYAMNVLRYATKPNTRGEVTPQFNAWVEAWVYSAQQYNKLRNFALEDWNLQEHDLVLGPCEDESFQRFEIVISPKEAAWRATEDTKKLALTTFKENKASDEDLEALCARKVEKKYIEQDLETVHDAWLEIQGVPTSAIDVAIQKTDDVVMSSRDLGTAAKDIESEKASASSTDIVMDFDELMKDL